MGPGSRDTWGIWDAWGSSGCGSTSRCSARLHGLGTGVCLHSIQAFGQALLLGKAARSIASADIILAAGVLDSAFSMKEQSHRQAMMMWAAFRGTL